MIVLGKLKNIRKKKKNKGNPRNQQLHAWAFQKFNQLLTYKAEVAGIRVDEVSERNTSKTCARCGTKGNRIKRGLFKCTNNKCPAYNSTQCRSEWSTKYLKQVSPTEFNRPEGVSGYFGVPPSKAVELSHMGIPYVEVEKSGDTAAERLKSWQHSYSGILSHLGRGVRQWTRLL